MKYENIDDKKKENIDDKMLGNKAGYKIVRALAYNCDKKKLCRRKCTTC